MNHKRGSGIVYSAYLATLMMVSFAVVSHLQQSTPSGQPAPNKIFAQSLVEETLAAHPEITGLEIATTPPGETRCMTIAANKTNDVGKKCEKDEFTAMNTHNPYLVQEVQGDKEVYGVTIPIHDAQGTFISAIGIEFKSEPNQRESDIVAVAEQITEELERKVPLKETLFELTRFSRDWTTVVQEMANSGSETPALEIGTRAGLKTIPEDGIDFGKVHTVSFVDPVTREPVLSLHTMCLYPLTIPKP
jgi:hypothetical protein